MGSSRLPGKILADLAGKSMLQRVVERISAAQCIDEIILATTTETSDNELVKYVNDKNLCKIFRGSENDVLSRFYECANLAKADLIIRITADDPLKDPEIISAAVNILVSNSDLDYCSNTIVPTFPEGLDVEVFRFSTLKRAYDEASLISEREHVTPYIWKHPEMFKLHNLICFKNLSDWRWTVDKPQDLVFMRKVFTYFKDNPLISYKEIISWLEVNPQIISINSSIKRNSGYLESVQSEQSDR
jgi:spore coat polysaccharide biosynthesis protein SpsF